MNKREFYSQSKIAQTYDELRFGGASGAWVNTREIDLALSLLPPFRQALDLGSGTGRLTRALAPRGKTIGMDASSAMLAKAQENNLGGLVQGDAFTLPFAEASFDAVVALRLVFHFAEVDALLREITRIVEPRGVFVFDTYLWSPRAWLPLGAVRWGSGVFAHRPALIEQSARQAGFQLARREFCFLFSPYIYRRLPLVAVHALAHIEPHLPARFRARVFWKFTRAG